ncbi:N-acetylneuraminate synthase [Candidatus Marinamargulisbacteria bacterium SCGC AG-410-N11]|nr:N-acetylneuraminate synthase [Candidatus Marinamargulisbacteria bacterium SCGC AG-410-N11]
MDKTFIIAEAGVNHNGELSLAKQLVDVAKSAGAEAVKFQTFKSETLATKNAKKATYQKETTNSDESQFDMLKKLELTHEMHMELINYCKQKEILFLSSPFDCDSVTYLERLNLPILKIPSGEILHVPYLRKIAAINKPTILSTGMCTMDDIEFGVTTLLNSGLDKSNLSLLHCTTEYPCPFEDVNLNAMATIQNKFEVPVGYSDHTPGITIPIAAVAMGATIIEKHFTLDKSLLGPDHKASLDPQELKAMVDQIRIVEKAKGNGVKEPSFSEQKNIEIVRKSILAKENIQKGETFTIHNLICKRPANGISPKEWDNILGKKAEKNYEEGNLI